MERTIKTQPFRATNCEHAFAIENKWIRIRRGRRRKRGKKLRDQFYNRSTGLNENDKNVYILSGVQGGANTMLKS